MERIFAESSCLGENGVHNYSIRVNTMKTLTSRQRAVLEFVWRFVSDRGYAPSLREIGEGVGLVNINAVRGHVAALERKGYIRRDPDQARSIRVLHPPSLLSRIKKRLHEMARTDQGVHHTLVYGLVLPFKAPDRVEPAALREAMAGTAAHLEAEHGWQLLRNEVAADHVLVVIQVWPNHSAELAARRIRAALAARARLGQGAWARGYAVTTDLQRLEDARQRVLAEIHPDRQDGADAVLPD